MDFFPVLIPPTVGFPDRLEGARHQGATVLVLQIPFGMIAPYAARARADHGKSLDRLAIDGGLGAGHILDLIEGRRPGPSHLPDAHRRLAAKMARHYAASPRPGAVPAFTAHET